MSLINDALKRASEEQSKPPTAADISANLTPVESTAQNGTQFWQVFGVVGLVAVALWLGWAWMGGKSNSASSNQQIAEDSKASLEVAARALTPTSIPGAQTPASTGNPQDIGANANPGLTPVVQAPIPTETPTPPPAPIAPTAVPTQPTLAAHPAAPANPTPTPPPAPAPAVPETQANTFPKLVLQGIYYRPSRPSAVINSKTLYVGDKVAQAKILAIDKTEVTVQWNGEVRVLAIE